MLGKTIEVNIGKQSTFAVPTTQARKTLNVYGVSGGLTENFVDDNILDGGTEDDSDPTEPAPGLDDHKITIKGPVCCNQMQWWLAAFFGDADSTGSAPNYEHEWATGQALPIIFMERKFGAKYRRDIGLIGESFSIDFSAEQEGFQQFEMTFVGLKELQASSALPGTVTAAPELVRPAAKLVNIVYNGANGGDLIGGKFSFARKLKRLRAADGSGFPYKVIQDGRATLTTSLMTRYEDDTFADDGISRAERAVSIELMADAARGLQIEFANHRINRTPLSVEGPDGIELNFEGRAFKKGADAAMVVRALSSAATVAFA